MLITRFRGPKLLALPSLSYQTCLQSGDHVSGWIPFQDYTTILTIRNSSQIDHRAGFDWFHYAGWEVPTMDPRYRTTVRTADQTVHGRLAKSRLSSLLDTVRAIGCDEIQSMKKTVGQDGKIVSLHTLLYRLGYNVNCIGIFGPQLDHVATRIALQSFTEVCVPTSFGGQIFTDTPPSLGSAYAIRIIQLAFAYLVEHSICAWGAKNDEGSQTVIHLVIQVGPNAMLFIHEEL